MIGRTSHHRLCSPIDLSHRTPHNVLIGVKFSDVCHHLVGKRRLLGFWCKGLLGCPPARRFRAVSGFFYLKGWVLLWCFSFLGCAWRPPPTPERKGEVFGVPVPTGFLPAMGQMRPPWVGFLPKARQNPCHVDRTGCRYLFCGC